MPKKNNYWLCIVKAEDKIPDEFDTKMRISLEQVMDYNDVDYETIYSGWGLPEEFANKLMSVLSKVHPKERNDLLNLLCQNRVGGIIGEHEYMPMSNQSCAAAHPQAKKGG